MIQSDILEKAQIRYMCSKITAFELNLYFRWDRDYLGAGLILFLREVM